MMRSAEDIERIADLEAERERLIGAGDELVEDIEEWMEIHNRCVTSAYRIDQWRSLT